MATGPVKTVAKPSVIKRLPSSSGQYDPFNPGGSTFQQQSLPTFTPATRAASGAVGNSPAAGAAQGVTGQGVNGVPQSFVDDLAGSISKTSQDFYDGKNPNKVNGQGAAVLSYQGKNYGIPLNPDGSFDQAGFSATVQQAWDATPADKKASYTQRDATNVAGQNTNQLQGIATQAALGGPAIDQQVANKLWGGLVDPAIAGANKTRADQITTDRQVEGDLTGATNTFTNTVNGNEATRMGDIQATNARDTGYAQSFMDETLATNKRNVGFADELTSAANSTNANQTGLFNTYSGQMAGLNANQTGLFNNFSGQMAGINANQTGLYNNFMGDISSANAQQNQNLAGLGSAVSSANSQQNQIVSAYSAQLANMNSEDRANYMKYLSETDPLMARMIAQNSDPQDVQNQQDVVSKYKRLANPEITDQERFLGELARRKTESDTKSSRDAVMSQLAGRGLKSGGLVIANQQQQAQQTGTDRQLNELGMNASAVQRSLVGMQGYQSASDALRGADDSMRHFQDQYAQNEAVRTGNLAQQRNQQGLATTGQMTARDTANYNARTQSNSLNYGRNLDYYNAGTQTVNNNFSRTQAGYDAGSQTNRDNAGRDAMVFDAGTTTNTTNQSRDQGVFDAGRATNLDNFGRTTTQIGTQLGVSQGNLGNYQNAISGPAGVMTVNDNNNTRLQGGLDKGQLAAGSILGAQTTLGGIKTTNRANETQAAANWVPLAASTAATGTSIQQGLTREQQDAIDKLFGQYTGKKAEATLGLG